MKKDTSWLRKSIMYSILIDRFARGGNKPWLNADASKPVFCGGDLQGIIDRLDYLKDLGVNTLLLSPFHPTRAYHGYHVLDFFGVEPRFGTPEILKNLLDEAHARDMHVIMDFVLSHVSREHPFFVDAQKDPKSEYREWFQFTDWPDEYVSFLNFRDLPKFDLTNAAVRSHVMDTALHWVDFGFDGLRLDHVIGIPHDFMTELHDKVKSRNPATVLIGEAVKGSIMRNELPTLHMHNKRLLYVFGLLKIPTAALLQRQYAETTDAVFDFFFRNMTKKFLVTPAWYKPVWVLRLILRIHSWVFPRNCELIRLLDNADHDRFSFAVRDNDELSELAARIMFSGDGPVMLFYGNAEGIRQNESRKYRVYGDKPFGDLAIRALMPWDDIDENTHSFYRSLIQQKNKRV